MTHLPPVSGPLGRDAILLRRLRHLLPAVQERAAALDADAAPYPEADLADMAAAGLMTAPLPSELGGAGWGIEPGKATALMTALRLVGRGSLPLGRLYEGHVNALRLVMLHGNAVQRKAAAAAARDGRLFGVWNAEMPGGGTWLGPDSMLHGSKIYCSGAGLVARALITARQGDGGPASMLLLPLDTQQHRADLAPWTAAGMRASATGHFSFEGMIVTPDMILGEPDAYFAQPDFSAGAWRFLAVQLGGAEALVSALRQHLRATGRGADPHQGTRFGQAVTALETARLWVARAAELAETGVCDAGRLLAYVDLARGAVEEAALAVLELTQRSIGLAAQCRPSPAERISRDLATYLRQPGPDRALMAGAAACLQDPAEPGDIWDQDAPR
ncbi:acyl-CoA dehydrogenase family protein [Pseudoroseomonas globiformis]|uniref:Acyl-CoA dehydrogenase family protein n=1 Tax=Teichococcus globiformis TaxID=2307229 RepID=A0ABV7FWX8_9PROT